MSKSSWASRTVAISLKMMSPGEVILLKLLLGLYLLYYSSEQLDGSRAETLFAVPTRWPIDLLYMISIISILTEAPRTLEIHD